MIDLRFFYDYYIYLNGTMPVGYIHTFQKSMIDVKYKDAAFAVVRDSIGRYITNVRV